MDITWQFICILCFMFTGLLVAFIHDFYRALINTIRIKGILYIVAEIIFAFISFTAVSTVLIWLTEGVVRPIYLVSVVLGIILYYLLYGYKVRNGLKRIMLGVQRILARILQIIIRICYVVGRIIMLPVDGILKISTCITSGFNGIMKLKK